MEIQIYPLLLRGIVSYELFDYSCNPGAVAATGEEIDDHPDSQPEFHGDSLLLYYESLLTWEMMLRKVVNLPLNPTLASSLVEPGIFSLYAERHEIIDKINNILCR
jgi:hypothetical protein